jgi:DNA-directed RNA polymerase specialized sigma24 family protein
MDESDADLLKATAEGDAEAFGRFYRRHEQRVLGYAIARCANAADVADVVGETFLGALGSAARFSGGDGDGDATPWLFGIARRVLAHQRRSFVRRQRLVRRLERFPSLNQVLPSQQHLADGNTVVTIVPSAIPAGWELSIGYFQVPDGVGIYTPRR